MRRCVAAHWPVPTRAQAILPFLPVIWADPKPSTMPWRVSQWPTRSKQSAIMLASWPGWPANQQKAEGGKEALNAPSRNSRCILQCGTGRAASVARLGLSPAAFTWRRQYPRCNSSCDYRGKGGRSAPLELATNETVPKHITPDLATRRLSQDCPYRCGQFRKAAREPPTAFSFPAAISVNHDGTFWSGPRLQRTRRQALSGGTNDTVEIDQCALLERYRRAAMVTPAVSMRGGMRAMSVGPKMAAPRSYVLGSNRQSTRVCLAGAAPRELSSLPRPPRLPRGRISRLRLRLWRLWLRIWQLRQSLPSGRGNRQFVMVASLSRLPLLSFACTPRGPVSRRGRFCLNTELLTASRRTPV